LAAATAAVNRLELRVLGQASHALWALQHLLYVL